MSAERRRCKDRPTDRPQRPAPHPAPDATPTTAPNDALTQPAPTPAESKPSTASPATTTTACTPHRGRCVCAICQRATGKARRLAVDHNHDTGDVRGLLCGRNHILIGRWPR